MHIVKELALKGYNVSKKKLNYGDYTVGFRLGKEKICLEDEIVVERKGSGNTGLDELGVNLTKYRKRFEKQLDRGKKSSFYLMIEGGNWNDIFNENYRPNITYKSYIASLMTYFIRYGIRVCMVDRECSAEWVYNLFYYYVREKLKRGDYDGN